jgi:ketosteroid isomerase-like protein
MTKEEILRNYYASWERKDWTAIDRLLADSFTFTSPNDDDHISKNVFKAKCWNGQVEYIQQFELESVLSNDTEGFVKYLCRTTNGTSFRNVEYFRFEGEKIAVIEVYFGGRLGYPSAAASGMPQ